MDINRTFQYHAPKGDQTVRYEEIRGCAKVLAEVITKLTPASREQSVALTNLQQAVMWANAAIAINE